MGLAAAVGCGSPAGHPAVRLGPDAPLTGGAAPTAAAIPTSPSTLQQALAATRGPVRILLGPGRYRLAPVAYTDPTCGNCTDPAEMVPATVGLLVRGAGIILEGAHRDSVIIETHAGYGILFDGCADCVLRGVTVTAGARDPDGRATNGGVVVRHGRVTIEGCRIAHNIGDSATVAAVVVGIAGVVGREGSDIRLRECVLERNSWDGVALYRGARAEITDNVIDGVDKAAGGVVGGGRGVGVGMTWDARAVVARNLVTRYWKGIGVFLDAAAEVRHNVVEDILTWGLAYWGPEGSRPSAVLEENAVYQTGACGASIERGPPDGPPPGRLLANAFARTGQNPRYDDGEPYCLQRPIARALVPAGFDVAHNLVHDVRQPGDAPLEPVLDRRSFREAVAPLVDRLRQQPATGSSRFVRDLGRAAPAGGPGRDEDPRQQGGVVFLVRHGETDPGAGHDVPLTAAGLERADRLAVLLRDAGIDAIHTTDIRRTRGTAEPLAAALGLELQVYRAEELADLAGRLRDAGGRRLVVGHSNTTPPLVRLLGGDPGPEIRIDEFDRLYVVVIEADAGGSSGTIILRY
jgi:phosphohistidine phosphatase SixA